MAKPQIYARVDEDIESAVKEFAEEHDISNSEATRRLLLTGLAKHERLPETLQRVGQPDDGSQDSTRTRAERSTLRLMELFAFVVALGGVGGVFSGLGVSLSPLPILPAMWVVAQIALVCLVLMSVAFAAMGGRLTKVLEGS